MEAESKQYSWKWVTADELLSHGPCELIYALLVPSGAGTCTATLYDGENTNGTPIVEFRCAESKGQELSPKKPVYCRQGLYVDCIAIVKGVFVQWRELGHKAGG